MNDNNSVDASPVFSVNSNGNRASPEIFEAGERVLCLYTMGDDDYTESMTWAQRVADALNATNQESPSYKDMEVSTPERPSRAMLELTIRQACSTIEMVARWEKKAGNDSLAEVLTDYTTMYMKGVPSD